MTDPVVLQDSDDGISYERRALEEWVADTGYVFCINLSIVYSQQLFSLGIFSVPSMPTLASPM